MKTDQLESAAKIPLVVRFAADRYDHEELAEAANGSKTIFSPFGEHTVTYDWTTKRGDDKDKADQHRD